MPRGTDTYRGLGLPQEGNVNLKAVSTADVFTVTQSSGGGGNFLVLRNRSTAAGGNVADSTLLTADKIRFSSLPALQFTSNTTVVQTISTAGIVGGQESTEQQWSIDSSGRARLRHVATTASTASTAITLNTTQSGEIVLVNGMAANMTVTLPLSSVSLGCEYTIVQTTGHSVAALTVSCTGGTGADILFAARNSTLPSTVQSIIPLSTLTGATVTLFCITTARWLAQPWLNHNASSLGDVAGGWGAGSTIA